ncbi:hypothetical protein J4434_06515 [Candidatus Woesearchaeota archaeon]|nr:hypothetical protein [Candidatus Woesearchaeota archaeon]
MQETLKIILMNLLSKRYIGGKHTPEDKLIIHKTKWLKTVERKEFEREYKELINQEIILRLKKRTGKGGDWHISINPRKLRDVYDLVYEGE